MCVCVCSDFFCLCVCVCVCVFSVCVCVCVCVWVGGEGVCRGGVGGGGCSKDDGDVGRVGRGMRVLDE